MQSRSVGSVKIFWLDKPKIIDCLQGRAADLAARKGEVLEVWLFGSLARGDAVPGSDADLLIVVADSDLSFYERGPEYAFDSCGIGVDRFVYTRAEFEQLRETRPRFHETLMKERKPLYRRETTA